MAHACFLIAQGQDEPDAEWIAEHRQDRAGIIRERRVRYIHNNEYIVLHMIAGSKLNKQFSANENWLVYLTFDYLKKITGQNRSWVFMNLA